MGMTYVPTTLSEALHLRAEKGARPLAGGSDMMVQSKRGIALAPEFPYPVMIITSIDELRGIRVLDDGSVEIGALTTAAEIAASEDVPWHVRMAASGMGAIALRNSATIGGNIGNASPKGDLPQPLIMLDASVVLSSIHGERRMLLDDFILGSKRTALSDDEIIRSVIIPPHDFTYSFYRKIGMRKANAISKLSLSAAALVKDGEILDFRASSGAAGPKVIRSQDAEKLLEGHMVSEIPELLPAFLEAWNNAISPHAMPLYRRNTTKRMLSFFLSEIGSGAEEGIIGGGEE